MPGELLFFSRFADNIFANVGSGMLDASGSVVAESLTSLSIETAGWTYGLLSRDLSSLRLRSGSESPFLSLMIEDGLELSDLSFLKLLKAS